jgi:RNA polymerase sigma factor (TIGR02999 family)
VKSSGVANDNSTALTPIELFAFVYDELRRLARRQRRAHHDEPTLDTTSLVHETYLKLQKSPHLSGVERPQFFALAAHAMRQILVDQARHRGVRRRSGQVALTTDASEIVAEERADLIDVVALDSALTQLAEVDPRCGELVEWRVFGGLEMADIAKLQGVTERTVARDWRRACAFLTLKLDATNTKLPIAS